MMDAYVRAYCRVIVVLVGRYVNNVGGANIEFTQASLNVDNIFTNR